MKQFLAGVRFTVDTHLFRELGELLVGRDSTALNELIKNAYDADATEVTVYASSLDDPLHGMIRVSDDGIGMTPAEFELGFLRVAARTKETRERRSRRFLRRYTGAKGIGRLAAHKLARILEVESVPEADGDARQSVHSRISWDAVEQATTLDEVGEDAVRVSYDSVATRIASGTTITLKHLRRKWTTAERHRFLSEVQTFEPPVVLVEPLKRSVVETDVLFSRATVRDTRGSDAGFKIRYEGEFEGGETFWQMIGEAASWVIELAAEKGRRVRCVIAPTRKGLKEYPDARPERHVIDHPDPDIGPFFQARIFVRDGAVQGALGREWNAVSGVRVFMEGFRVLPYGERKNDWLGLDSEYTRRSRGLPWMKELAADAGETEVPHLRILPNSSYFGGVFLTEAGAGGLRMLVNREGFVPDTAFEHLTDLIRWAINLSVRTRAAASDDATTGPTRTSGNGSSAPGPSVFERAVAVRNELKRLAVAAELREEQRKHIQAAIAAVDDLLSEAALLRVLASVGTQMSAFVHEIRNVLSLVESLDRATAELRESDSTPPSMRRNLARLHKEFGTLKTGLERQASYLVDVVSPDARRRRSRQRLAERFEAARRLVATSAERRGISILNQIPEELRTPPMFGAELVTVFANLLTNAVRAAGEGGSIRATGRTDTDGSVRVKLENTGRAVNVRSSERWFRPYESSTREVDPILGQGMGMGLPITRRTLDEYSADIRFVDPTAKYATAIEISFPA